MTTKILVVGDCMLDVYVEGSVPRMSPEANVPIFVPSGQERCQAGGAAAVAMMAAYLGKEPFPRVTLAGVVGKDWAGTRLKNELGHIVKPLFEYGATTTTKTRLVTPLGQVVRIDRDVQAWNGVPGGKYGDWLDAACNAAKSADVVLLADYDKGAMTDEAIREIIAVNDRVIVDPARGRPWRAYRNCWGIKANAAERSEFLNRSKEDQRWFCKYEWSVTTMGNGGMQVVAPGNLGCQFPVRESHCVDATGCGDQVLATLGVLLAEGMQLEEACRWANCAGGLCCEKKGATPVTRDELEAEMAGTKEYAAMSCEGK